MFLVFLSTCDAGNVIGYSILFGIGIGNGEFLRTTNRWIDTTGRTQFQESAQRLIFIQITKLITMNYIQVLILTVWNLQPQPFKSPNPIKYSLYNYPKVYLVSYKRLG